MGRSARARGGLSDSQDGDSIRSKYSDEVLHMLIPRVTGGGARLRNSGRLCEHVGTEVALVRDDSTMERSYESGSRPSSAHEGEWVGRLRQHEIMI